MANKKELHLQIEGVRNTQKITKAMSMVAISKISKIQERMLASRPYTQSIRSVIGHLALGDLIYSYPYLKERKVSNVGYLIISTDRGLCGGLNMGLFKTALNDMQRWTSQHVGVHLALIGAKSITFFHSMNLPILAEINGIGDYPVLSDLIGVVNVMLTAYDQGRLDRLYLVYNKYINTLSQSVQIEQLLPLPKGAENEVKEKNWDYIYEPHPKMLLDALFSRFIESQVYQGVIENLSCEQASRMVAMQSATDNADKLLNELQCSYNKRRQADITQELNEIIAGATAT